MPITDVMSKNLGKIVPETSVLHMPQCPKFSHCSNPESGTSVTHRCKRLCYIITHSLAIALIVEFGSIGVFFGMITKKFNFSLLWEVAVSVRL